MSAATLTPQRRFFMNKKLIFSVLLVVCLLAVVSVVAFSQTSPNVRWEYKWSSSFSPEDYNELGKQGWEAVAFSDRMGLLLKRRLP